jgi:hypothetical protein
MPFKSKAQQRWMYANKPKMAKEWAAETDFKHLPARAKHKKKKSEGGYLRGKKCMSCGGKMQGGGPLLDPHLGDAQDPWGGVPSVPQLNLPQYNPNDLQAAISQGLIAPPRDFDSAQQAYDFYNRPQPKRMNWPWNNRTPGPNTALLGMKAAQNVLGFIGGAKERRRQDNYMYDQFDQMGQIDPVPVSNFQPNPYNMYARFGGSLRRYQIGGMMKGDIDTNIGRRPITAQDVERMSTFAAQRRAPGSVPMSGDQVSYPGDTLTANQIPSAAIQATRAYGKPDLMGVGVHDKGEPFFINAGQRQGQMLQYRLAPQDIDRINQYAKGHPLLTANFDDNYLPAPSKFRKGGWIQKAVNPAHKGFCTPMSKPTCTPRRKALARRFKAMAKD